MEYGRVLEQRVDEALWELASLVPEDRPRVAAQDIAEVERRLTDVQRTIHQQPSKLIGPEFVARLDETLAFARDQFATIRRYAP